ncbi:hypothetical protein ACJX0J_032668, partial [Zea mays]
HLISGGGPSVPLISVICLSGSRLATGAAATRERCEQSYGFLPCTAIVFENLFLMLEYAFLMYKVTTYLLVGSELLLGSWGSASSADSSPSSAPSPTLSSWHKLYHFLSTLQQYLHFHLSDISWRRFQHSLKNQVRDILDLEYVHICYITDALD